MMPRPPGTVDPYKWTLDLPAGPNCSVGWSGNMIVGSDGSTSNTGRVDEDRYYTCIFQDKVQLYMVLDGHDGVRACEFVQKHLPSVFLRCNLGPGDEAVKEALKTAFNNTEREFFKRIDPHIARKITLQIEISQKASNSIEAIKRFPDQVEEIERLDSQIKGGTTVAVAAIYNQRLYVANVGDTRVLLCSVTPDGKLRAVQLSVDHNTSNADELQRLVSCGLDTATLRRTKRVGTQQNSRSIGDYSIKGGYKDIDIISHARMEPGSAEPFIHEAIDLSRFQGFLVVMSDGLYEAYESWTRRPAMVNEDIADLIANEMKKTADISIVAQSVVEKVKSLFRNNCQKDHRTGRLDDITLIVKNIGFPMAPAHAVSHPSDFTSGPIQGYPVAYMQSMSVQPSTDYSHYPLSHHPRQPSAGYPGYPTNVPNPQWSASGGGVYYHGGPPPPASMPYPGATDAYGRSVSYAPTTNVYNQYPSNQSTGPNTMVGYPQSVRGGTNAPGMPITTGVTTTDFHQQPPQQPVRVPVTTAKYHHPVSHMNTEPTLQQTSPKHPRASVPSRPDAYYPPQSQVPPQYFQGTTTQTTATTTVSTFESNAPAHTTKTHEYKNTKKKNTLQVDPNDRSPYVNVGPSNEDAQSKRHKRLSDSSLEKPDDYRTLTEADVKASSQTPPTSRPKSADVSQMTANRTPDGKPIPAPRGVDLQKQRSVEKKSSSDELLELYGWLPGNGSSNSPKSGSEVKDQNPPQPQPQQGGDSEVCISFFNSGDLSVVPKGASQEKKNIQQQPPQKQQKQKDNPDDSDGEFVVNDSDSTDDEPEPEPMSDSEEVPSYIKNWAMIPSEMSYDDIVVNM